MFSEAKVIPGTGPRFEHINYQSQLLQFDIGFSGVFQKAKA